MDGSNNIGDVAYYGKLSGGPTEVGEYNPNELGIYDMSGNVWEWCQDWYGSYSSGSQTDPTGPTSGSRRVYRGGSCYDIATYCRVANHFSSSPSGMYGFLGFRLALTDQQEESDVVIPEPIETLKTYTANGVSFNMVLVEKGTFTMGATSEQIGADSGEKPAHSVTLTKSYYIGETEVTQELYQAVMGSNPSYYSGAQRPVEYVSWNDCQAFITKLNSLTGLTFRLPTEAEWEFAARGGNQSKKYLYSGSNTIGDVAWYDGNTSSAHHNVKTKAPNELGIYDMSGNVWEWCQDWYGSYSSGSQTDPIGPTSGSDRVIRGGGWNYDTGFCRVAYRYGSSPSGTKNGTLGFRLAL